MGVGDFASGFTQAISNYLTSERERNRKLEDEELDYRRSMIESLISRPDFNPAYLGKALHDLVEIGQAKTSKRKMKGGAEGFAGASELPMSQFFQGMMDGTTPIVDPPAPAPPTVAAGMGPVEINRPRGPVPVRDLHPGAPTIEASPFTGEAALSEPIAVPPPGMPVSNTAGRLVSAARDMQKYQNRPAPLLKSADMMAKEKASAQGIERDAEYAGKVKNINTYLTDPEDQNMAVKSMFGVPVTQSLLLGTKPEVYITPDGRRFTGQPMKAGGIYNHTTGQPEAGAMLENEANNRLSSLYQLAAAHLGLPQDSASWAQIPGATDKMVQFLMSFEGQRLSQQYGLNSQFAVARAWNMPQLIRGQNAQGGDIQVFGTPNQMTGGGPGIPRIAVPPMPAAGAAAQPQTPNFSVPPQPAIAPPPVNPTPGIPNMQNGVTATPNPQRPVVQPTPAQTPPNAFNAPAQSTNALGLAVDASGNVVAPSQAAERADIQNQSTALGLLKLIRDKYMADPAAYNKIIGPYIGRYQQYVTPLNPFQDQDPLYSEIAPLVTSYRDRMIKAITGAQMSAAEQTRLMQSLPDMNNEPGMFLSNLNAQGRVIQETVQGYIARGKPVPPELLEAAQGLGIQIDRSMSGLGTIPQPPTVDAQPREGDRREIPGFPGTEATFIRGKWVRTK